MSISVFTRAYICLVETWKEILNTVRRTFNHGEIHRSESEESSLDMLDGRVYTREEIDQRRMWEHYIRHYGVKYD